MQNLYRCDYPRHEVWEDVKAKQIIDVENTVTNFFKDILGKPIMGHFKGQVYGVIAIQPEENGWRAVIEVVDEMGMGMDPVLGLYEVHLDKDLNITAYERKSMRRSTEVSKEKATIPSEKELFE